MKAVLLLGFIMFATLFPARAVVVVNTPNTSVALNSEKPIKITNQKKIKKHTFSFKKLFSKLFRIFDFDLSDPVDGWLSLAIILIVGALVLILLGGILGISLLSLIGSILAGGAFISFIIWVFKML